MTLRLNGSTSGFTQIDAAAVAGDNSITLPTLSGAITIKDSSGNTEVGTGVTFNNPSANVFAISNSGGERLHITSDGKFGLGLTPSMFFEVYSQSENDIARFSGPNSGNIVFRNDTSNEIQIHTGTNDALIFGTNGENERLRIDSGGNVTLGYGGNSLYFQNGFNNSSSRIQNGGASGSSTLRFYTNDSGSEGERIRIAADGTTSFYKFADFIRGAGDGFGYLGIGPGGTDEKATFVNRSGEIDLEFYSNYSGSPTISINSGGSISASSVNLQSSGTSSWFQTGTSIASYSYVWAAKNSSSNVWHSGLQTDGDLYLGGNLASTNNIGLSGSNGTGFFQNPSGDTTLSLGDLSNSNGRLVLAAKTSSLEIHSRSNHPINFLFNTTQKASLGIGGDLSLSGGITLTGQTNTTASGASASSDAFDHYEEGTWTPNFNGLSSAFSSYSNKVGTYVRIGSWCHIQGFIQLSGQPSFTNGNAYLMLGPLPFNYSNQNAGYNVTVGNVSCQGFNFHDNDYSNTGQIACGINNDSGTSYVIFQVCGNDNVRGIVQNSAIGSDDIIEFTLSYRV